MKTPKKIFVEVEDCKIQNRFYIGDRFANKDIEYVLAGSERKAVVRRLEKWIDVHYYVNNDGTVNVNDLQRELKKIKEGK